MTPRRGQPLSRLLGPLEAEVMEVVWANDRATVRDVYRQIKNERPIAYTTVMTTMVRLSEKGFLERQEAYPAHIFSSAVSRDDYVRSTVKSVVDWLVNQFRDPAVAYLVAQAERGDPAVLEGLMKAIEERQARPNGD